MEIDLGICTFRRSHLAETLRSLAALEMPPECRLRIIVADNDETPSAREVVDSTAVATGLAITYLQAPARNISIARNACLDAAVAPLFAFIDDDELATPGWLAALLAGLGDCEAVLGPVQALYAENAPGWLRRGDFHSTYPVWVAGEIRTGYTCNVLFRRTAPAFAGRRFREDLGGSGGEDTVFFATAWQAGARFAYAPAAVVTEPVPPNRATFRWLWQRRFRAGQTHARLAANQRVKLLATALAKLLFCSAMIIIQPHRARAWLLRGTLHLGVIAGVLGRRESVLYG